MMTTEATKDVNVFTGGNGMGGFGGCGFGGDGYWLIILFLLFAFCGGGWGGYGGGGQVGDNYVLASDMSQLSRQISDTTAMTERKLDGVNNGLCSGFYQEAQLINGVNQNVANANFAIQNAITQDTISNLQGFNGLQAAVKDCCCTTQQNTKDTQYIIATQANGITNAVNNGFCTTNFNAQTNTRDIIDAQNANTRAILEAINANKVEALRDENAALRAAVNTAQSETRLINTLRPCPQPAFITCNPWASNGTSYNTCGCA